jgi:alpha-beta hydrolase superfamily lysophospholipase
MRLNHNKPWTAIFGPRQRRGPTRNPKRLAASRGGWAAVMVAAPLAAFAQIIPAPPPLPAAGGTAYRIFLRGAPIGTEQIATTRTADGWTIVSSGRIAAPLDVVGRRIQVRYTADWHPLDFSFDATVRGQQQTIRASVDGTTATSHISAGGQTADKSDTIASDAVIVLPSSFFGPYEALAARLRTAASGTTIPIYVVSQGSFSVRAGDSASEQIQTAGGVVSTRRTHITLMLPGAVMDADLWGDQSGRLVRMSLPAQSLEFVREDVASVAARTVPISRPNDEPVKIPGNGFVLAGTVSRPTSSTEKQLPAAVLVGGSGQTDRDEVTFGIPILGQIANALADAGFIVVRYDKRGIGQSGGRAEAATLADFGEDLRATVKWLSDRKDVDDKRIAVVGHNEGGAVALLAAAKEKRIAAAVLISANGVTGAELVLEQQQHMLNRSAMSPEEKQAKVELQKRIHDAVITGKGWDQVPAAMRQQVDNPEFQSLLMNDPAKVMPDVKQPLLIVQGELDTQVAPSNADKLEALARKRKSSPPVEVVKVPGVNHLLIPAKTGEVDEYSTLTDKQVSATVTDPIISWLKKTLSSAR